MNLLVGSGEGGGDANVISEPCVIPEPQSITELWGSLLIGHATLWSVARKVTNMQLDMQFTKCEKIAFEIGK